MDTHQPTHWLLRVGDGKNFNASKRFRTWGINSTHTYWAPSFLRNVRPGDILWFILAKSHGKVIGVATYAHMRPREVGPLIPLTPTDEDLGWTTTPGGWGDTEIHYTDLYDVTECNLLTDIKGPLVGRKYDPGKCAIDLPREYANLVRYSKAFLVPVSHRTDEFPLQVIANLAPNLIVSDQAVSALQEREIDLVLVQL